jgi:uncharacterized protein YbjT (DUF2867 family)
MRIAVAGGTGTVGRHVVEAAIGSGHQTVVLARSAGVDLRRGDGLTDALAGVDVIIDTTNPASVARAKATDFFTEVTGHLQAAGAAQGVGRLVVLSIVGIDRVPSYGYYRAKAAHEEAARSGPVTASVVRATQFHEFAGQLLARSRMGPVAIVPVMRVQPVAARAVAATLVETATSPHTPDLVEVAGPRPEDLVGMARAVVAAEGRRVVVVPLRVPGAVGRQLRAGGLLPGTGVPEVGPTFGDWLTGDDGPRSRR